MGGEPAAPGGEVEDRVTQPEVQLLHDQPQAVEDGARVLHGAERLVEDVPAARGVGGDGLPVFLGVAVELVRPGQELSLAEAMVVVVFVGLLGARPPGKPAAHRRQQPPGRKAAGQGQPRPAGRRATARRVTART